MTVLQHLAFLTLVFGAELPFSPNSNMMSVMGQRTLLHIQSTRDKVEVPKLILIEHRVLFIDTDFPDEPCDGVIASNDESILG